MPHPTGVITINFNSPCTAGGLATFGPQTVITPGLISVEYTAEGCSGADVITASLFQTGETAAVTLNVEAPEVLSVSFVVATSPQISLAGWTSQGLLDTF